MRPGIPPTRHPSVVFVDVAPPPWLRSMVPGTTVFSGSTGFGRDDKGDWLQVHLFEEHFPGGILRGGVVEDPGLIKSLNRAAAVAELEDQPWNFLPFPIEVQAMTALVHDDDEWSVIHTVAHGLGPGIHEEVVAKNANDAPLLEAFAQLLEA